MKGALATSRASHQAGPATPSRRPIKLMIVDDAVLRIGSSNLCNRSMALDSECDLVVESRGQPRVAEAIVALRDRLLAEHLATEPARLREAIEQAGGVNGAIEAFRAQPRTLREHWFAADLEKVLWAPLDEYDRRFDAADRFRVAAGVYAFAVKQPAGTERLIPDEVMEIYARSPELQTRFPEPLNLSLPDNLMLWAKGEGAACEPALAAWRASEANEVNAANQPRFRKWFDTEREYDRGTVAYYPAVLTDGVEPQPPNERHLNMLGRRMTVRVPFGWSKQGAIGMVRRRSESLLRWAGVMPARRPPLES